MLEGEGADVQRQLQQEDRHYALSALDRLAAFLAAIVELSLGPACTSPNVSASSSSRTELALCLAASASSICLSCASRGSSAPLKRASGHARLIGVIPVGRSIAIFACRCVSRFACMVRTVSTLLEKKEDAASWYCEVWKAKSVLVSATVCKAYHFYDILPIELHVFLPFKEVFLQVGISIFSTLYQRVEVRLEGCAMACPCFIDYRSKLATAAWRRKQRLTFLALSLQIANALPRCLTMGIESSYHSCIAGSKVELQCLTMLA